MPPPPVRVERRYLLAGCADGAVAAFDVVYPSPSAPGAAAARGASSEQREHSAVFQVLPCSRLRLTPTPRDLPDIPCENIQCIAMQIVSID